jgi:hypothetical protein
MSARDAQGGTSPKRVAKQLDELDARIAQERRRWA